MAGTASIAVACCHAVALDWGGARAGGMEHRCCCCLFATLIIIGEKNDRDLMTTRRTPTGAVARLRPRRMRGRRSRGWRCTGCASISSCGSPISPTCALDARVDRAAAGRHLPGARPLSRALALREPRRPAAHRACRRRWARCSVPLVLVMLQLQSVVPRSVLILYPIVLIFLMAGNRFAYRIWKEHRLYSPLAALGEPVLIVGAGEAGRASRQGAGAQPAVARRRPARRRPGQAGAAACATSTCLARSPSLPTWARNTACAR